MAAVVVPLAPEKTVLRCVLSDVHKGSNLASEARKRFNNHQKWLQQKSYASKLQQKRKKEEEELERLRKAQLEEDIQRKARENKIRVQQWFEEKQKLEGKKKKEKIVAHTITPSTVEPNIPPAENQKTIQEWSRLKSQQKKEETKEKDDNKKYEEEQKMKRKALSEVCYEQWKENVKLKSVILPRNGYQIFGPKPAPVVPQEWVPYQPPKISYSARALNTPKLFIIKSFRSEGLISNESSDRSIVSKLDLSSGSRISNIMPWEQRTGGCHARGTPKKSVRALTWTERSSLNKNTKKPKTTIPPFRP